MWVRMSAAHHRTGKLGGTHLTARDGKLYVTGRAQSNALYIYDVSQPLEPVELSALSFRGPAMDHTFVGDFLVTAGTFEGLRTFDVSDPAAPVELSVTRTLSFAWGVAAAKGHVFVADGYALLQVYSMHCAP